MSSSGLHWHSYTNDIDSYRQTYTYVIKGKISLKNLKTSVFGLWSPYRARAPRYTPKLLPHPLSKPAPSIFCWLQFLPSKAPHVAGCLAGADTGPPPASPPPCRALAPGPPPPPRGGGAKIHLLVSTYQAYPFGSELPHPG